MALIQPLNKTIEVINAINAGNDTEAASMLGLNCNRESSSGGSFLERVTEVAASGESHNGGVLVTPETKTISNKELVADALELPYAVAESISILVGNAITALSTLAEEDEFAEPDEEGNVDSEPPIDNEGVENIKNTMTDGLNVAQDALVDVFATTAKLNIKARELFKSAMESNGSSKDLYVSLVGNAVTGAGILYAISKISDFSNDNAENVEESMDATNVMQRADDILFATLNLQENLIDLCIQMNKFNNNVINLLEEAIEMPDVSSGTLEDASEFISMAIEKIATPVSDNEGMLKGEIKSTFDKAVSCVAALYDEYIQDFCNSEDIGDSGDDVDNSEDPTNAGEPDIPDAPDADTSDLGS